MKETELRIGNYVQLNDGEIIEVIEIPLDENGTRYIMDNDHHLFLLSDVQPIPLTEEWMLKGNFENWADDDKFGYIQYALHNVIDGTSDFIILQNYDDGIWYASIDGDICCWADFKYIHQLQNLYYALIGIELEFN